jgi:transcriptional regulator GlxA family with amidase domain
MGEVREIRATKGARPKPLRIAILLYPGVTALDVVGPWEVLSRLPNASVRFVGKRVGPVIAEGGSLRLGVTHTLAQTSSADVVLVPGGSTTPGQMIDGEILEWIRRVHESTTWTASVSTGALILGAAGLLKGRRATTHWWKMGVLKALGARPSPDWRFVRSGRIVTAAGVSAGIDLALWLAGEIAGRERAEAIQLSIEYDPRPPFDSGHRSRASEAAQASAREILEERMPREQRRLVPRIALRRFMDLIRNGK